MNSETPAAPVATRPIWPGYLLGVYAVVVSVVALIMWKAHPAGWAVLTRPVLSLLGLAGGLLLLCGDPWWRPLIRLWAFAQVAVIILDPSGSLTWQPFFWLAVSSSGAVVINEQVRQLQGYGINVVGMVLFLAVEWIVVRKYYRDTPQQRWQFLLLRLVRSLFVLSLAGVAAYLGWRFAPLFLEKQSIMVLDSPFPGVELYSKDRKLGTTPLMITQEKLAQWGLSVTNGPPRCLVHLTPLEHGFLLTGNKATALVLAKPPGWSENHFLTFASEWGSRAVLDSGVATSNRFTVHLLGRNQPGLLLELPQGFPRLAAAGQTVDLAVRLRRQPLDQVIKTPSQIVAGQKAVLFVNCVQGAVSLSKEVALPEAWRNPQVGSVLEQVVKVPAPEKPGKYEVLVQYRLFLDSAGQKRLDLGTARSYGFVEVR